MFMENIRIAACSPAYKDEVIRLVLNIQQHEFQVNVSLEDQPDLEAVETVYQSGNGNFWVALANTEVAGTVGLLDAGNGIGALRKMFVKKEFRGGPQGAGQLLLNTLLKWAREKGFKKIYLGTTEAFAAARRFYEKNGFIEIDKSMLPACFPLMKVDVIFYEYSIP
jgi:N-acetylglutamate synthase-like GNAT family acetyltransferase